MTEEIFYYIFLINHVYLILVLAKQNFKSFWFYILELSIASTLCLIAIKWRIHSLSFIIINAAIFLVWNIFPLYLSKKIATLIQKKAYKKIVIYARLRYFTTLSRLHLDEYRVFTCWSLLFKEQYLKALKISEALSKKISEDYHIWLKVIEFSACFHLGRWQDAIDIFEEDIHFPLELVHPATAARVIEAYCYTGDISEAITRLIEFESHPERKEFPKEFTEARLVVHCHCGNLEKVKFLLDKDIEGIQKSYWLALCKFFMNNEEGLAACEDDLKLYQKKYRDFLKQNGSEILELEYYEYFKEIESTWDDSVDSLISLPKKSFFWKTPISYTLIILNVLMFFILEITGGSTAIYNLFNFGANNYELVFIHHQYWRLITSMFLHFGWLHLIFNVIGLSVLGEFIENFYGKKNYIIIYFFSGIFASICTILLRAKIFHISVGASGAICGLIGANAYFFFFKGKKLKENIRKHYSFSFLFMIFAMGIIGYIIPQIDNAAHFGGLLAGFVLGYILQVLSKKMVVPFQWLSFLLIIPALMLTLFFQVSSVVGKAYPRNISPAWYSMTLQNRRMKFSIPSSWKMDSLIKKEIQVIKTSRNLPYTLQKRSVTFWDIYNTGENGNLFINLNVSHTIKIQPLEKTLKEVVAVYKKDKRLAMISKIQKKKYGTKIFYSFSYEISQERNSRIYVIFCNYIEHNNTLCQFRFQFTKKDLELYKFLIEKVLMSLEFY